MTVTAPRRLEVFANGNPKPDHLQKPEVLAAHERLMNSDPRELSIADFNSIGHLKRPLLAIIRQNCIECQSGYEAEVRRCQLTGCPFWPYRMGTNPFYTVNLSEEQKEERRARLRAVLEARQRDSR